MELLLVLWLVVLFYAFTEYPMVVQTALDFLRKLYRRETW